MQQPKAFVIKPYSPSCDSLTQSPPAFKPAWKDSSQQQGRASTTTPGATSSPDASFIKTVPMQHVQSHYAAAVPQQLTGTVCNGDFKSDATPKHCMQPMLAERVALRQAAAQPLAALLSLSPELSDGTVSPVAD